MKVQRDEAFERFVLDQLKAWYAATRSGIHQSDLVFCLRKAYWNKTDPVPLTDEEVLFFVLGEGHHYLLEHAMKGFAREQRTSYHGVHMTTDLLGQATETGVPTELKTTRQSVRRHDDNGVQEEAWYYVDQVGNYLLGWDAPLGRLVVLHLVGAWSPPTPALRSYTITFDSDAERDLFRRQLLAKKEALEACLDLGIVPPGPSFEEECSTWRCRYAPRCVHLGLRTVAQTWLGEASA